MVLKQLIHIKVFNQSCQHDVWISDCYKIDDFLEDIKESWFCAKYAYKHFIYHVELDCFLDGTKSFKENQVIQSDHLFLF